MTRIALLSLALLTSAGLTGCYSCGCNSYGMNSGAGYNPCSTCSGPSYGSCGSGNCSSSCSGCGSGTSMGAAAMPLSPEMLSQMGSPQGAILNQPAMSNASYPNIVQDPPQAPGVFDAAGAPPQGYALPAPPAQFQSMPMANAPMATPVTQMGYQQPMAAPVNVNAMTGEQLFAAPSTPQYLTRAQYASVFPQKGKKCSCGMVH